MPTHEAADWAVKDMLLVDIPAVVSIENQAQISPWSSASFKASLEQGHICRCLWLDSSLVAYCILQGIEDELHILNVVVAPSVQGQGWAHVLMHDLFSMAKSAQVTKLFLDVRESNIKAQALYEKWGFELLSVRRQYYRNGVGNQAEDALVYIRNLEV